MRRRTFLVAAAGIGASIGGPVVAGQEAEDGEDDDGEQRNDTPTATEGTVTPTPRRETRTPTGTETETETPTPTPQRETRTPTETETPPATPDDEDRPTPTETRTPTDTPENDSTPAPTDTPQEEATPTPTAGDTADEGGGSAGTGPTDLEFVHINYDASGNDHGNRNGEWVEFRNPHDRRIALGGCRVTDRRGATYEFGEATVPAGASFRLYTGNGRDDERAGEYYWGHHRAVWNNDGDTVYFYNRNGKLLVRESYSGDCRYGRHPCSSGGSGWNPPFTATETRMPARTSRTPASTRTETSAREPHTRSRTETATETRSEPVETAAGDRSTWTPDWTRTATPSPTERPSTPVTVGGSGESTRTPTATETAASGGGERERTTTRGERALADGSGLDVVDTLATIGGLAAATAHLLGKANESESEGGD